MITGQGGNYRAGGVITGARGIIHIIHKYVYILLISLTLALGREIDLCTLATCARTGRMAWERGGVKNSLY